MELTTEDKARIEQEAKERFSRLTRRMIFLKGAEYATLYERQQQAKELHQLINIMKEKGFYEDIILEEIEKWIKKHYTRP